MKHNVISTAQASAGLPSQTCNAYHWPLRVRTALSALMIFLATAPLRAQSPWEQAVQVLQTSFTGPIAKGLSLVSIVVGGLMFAFGEGQSKRALAGILFGVGMAIGAVNFMAWLFP
jgi:type IV secretion system protein TrbC